MAKKNSNYSILVDVELQTADIQKQLNNATKNAKVTLDTKDAQRSANDLASSVEDMGLTFQEANLIMSRSIEVITAMVDEVYSLDTALTEFKKVSDLSGASLDKYVEKLNRMGDSVARTGSEMIEAATDFRKNGFNDEDAAQLGQIAA